MKRKEALTRPHFLWKIKARSRPTLTEEQTPMEKRKKNGRKSAALSTKSPSRSDSGFGRARFERHKGSLTAIQNRKSQRKTLTYRRKRNPADEVTEPEVKRERMDGGSPDGSSSGVAPANSYKQAFTLTSISPAASSSRVANAVVFCWFSFIKSCSSSRSFAHVCRSEARFRS